MRVLGVITARGGSKGIPRKNIRPLCGKPLLQYTAEAALASRRLTRVILSTDDEVIAEAGIRCGLEVPFLRPAELAQDDSPSLPVVQHAVRRLEEQGARFDGVCLLQPTNPLRSAAHIDACVDLLDESGVDAVVTVLPVPAEHNPHWVYFRTADGALQLSMGAIEPIPRRQDLPEAFHREGSVYAVRRAVLMEQNSLYGTRLLGYPMNAAACINLNSLEDWEQAERMLSVASRA